MKCPCKGCERAGCGAYHEECEPYKAWKAEREDVNKWLRDSMPPTSEAGLKGQRERLKRGKSRKWNIKNQYNRGES